MCHGLYHAHLAKLKLHFPVSSLPVWFHIGVRQKRHFQEVGRAEWKHDLWRPPRLQFFLALFPLHPALPPNSWACGPRTALSSSANAWREAPRAEATEAASHGTPLELSLCRPTLVPGCVWVLILNEWWALLWFSSPPSQTFTLSIPYNCARSNSSPVIHHSSAYQVKLWPIPKNLSYEQNLYHQGLYVPRNSKLPMLHEA